MRRRLFLIASTDAMGLCDCSIHVKTHIDLLLLLLLLLFHAIVVKIVLVIVLVGDQASAAG